ncbi:GNAT family N-acetyltransferase [Streptomyces sp. SID14478]|uniref:GNAT family N-acetyltransferase n=1 Tax=Streptomyces sp. SID14478 TaxID=2706073 RepID=UPI0013DC19B6|nr:GNAT family N-acetyltransferase [Streptomyces sp. SID14478]NEB77463.1 GNAT family N-acetyltransferase [Streptomyces sp. SID14478]
MGMSVTISAATEADTEQILKLQYLCYQSEAQLYGDYSMEPLTQSLDSVRAELTGGAVLVARLGDEVVASVRGTIGADGTARINKLIVHPRMQRHGLGGRLLAAVEAELGTAGTAKRFELLTGHRSEHNLRLYRKHGYEPVATKRVDDRLTLVTLAKDVGAASAATAFAATA